MNVQSEELVVPVQGVCCAEEASAVEAALCKIDGVHEAQTLLAAERVTVRYDPARTGRDEITRAIEAAGFGAGRRDAARAGRDVGALIGWASLAMVAVVVGIAALGERLGVIEDALALLPWWVPAIALVLGGLPVFRGVVQAALRRQVTSHTLMTAGVIASAAIGEWTTAALIVFFMRFADWLEDRTTDRAREAIRLLTELAPATARVVRDGVEVEVSAADVRVGETLLVRPGERIAADGVVVAGSAAIDESSLTGESIPVDKAVGSTAFASTIAQGGYLEIRATKTGDDTTFARIVRLVEEAEAQKAPVQRFADRFAAYYLPVVLVLGVLTYFVTGRVLNAVAVVVVACACAIVIATPVVVLASVGSAARRGLVVKGGLALERLAKVDAVVLDKTGTLTYGRPELARVIALNGVPERDLLASVAALEAKSEHPLAHAVVRAARSEQLVLAPVAEFRSLPGQGVVGHVGGERWAVGTRVLLEQSAVAIPEEVGAQVRALEGDGNTVFFAAQGARLVGLLALADQLRPDAPAAITALRRLGIREFLLLTGDSEAVAAAVAGPLGIPYRAGLLPGEKLAAIRELQAGGRVVLMVGDGVNDAPALAQADVGLALGAAGSDIAIETADVALLRDDWSAVPEVLRIGRRAAATIRQNLAFAAIYNLAGLALAAVGVLPPVWAAAAQSLPDVAIMLNSARLLRR